MAKSVCIVHTGISIDGKCLEHYHILNIARMCYDMHLVAIELD
jgi:hypothetical protein